MTCILKNSKKSIERCIEEITNNEKIDGIVVGSTVYSMSCFTPMKEFDKTPFHKVERFMKEYTRRDDNSLIEIIKQLYSFSILMKNDSSWCSRSEHEFEKLYADSEMPHGQLVLMGALVAMKIRSMYKLPDLYERLLVYCRKLEISMELKQEFDFMIVFNTYKRMKDLSSVRPEKFGLWNLVDSTNIDWKPLIQEIKKEL